MNDPGYYDPSQITPEIYVGPQYYRVGKGRLERLGIRYSINMQAEFDSASSGLALEQHCYLPTEDDEAPGIDQLRLGIGFLEGQSGTVERYTSTVHSVEAALQQWWLPILLIRGWQWMTQSNS